MKMSCFTEHASHICEMPNGIRFCMLCAAKHEMAQSIRNFMARMETGIFHYRDHTRIDEGAPL